MRLVWLSAVVAIFVLSGCAPESTPQGGEGESPAESAAMAEVKLEELLATADIKRGQTLFLQCRACHSLEAGEPHKVGPNLHGMFGRKAGLAEGFAYSPALSDTEIVWTPEALDAWLLRPSEFLPGNRMVFIGVKKPADRANLIAYLQQATAVTSE